MRKNLSRAISLLLCLAMLASMLVIPTHAINDVMDIPVKAGCYMTLETNKHGMSYSVGDEVELTVRLHDADGNQISAPYIQYNLRVDGSNDGGYGEYQLYWTTVPFKDGEYTIKTTATKGFMRLRVDILDENKNIIKRSYNASEGDWSAFGPSGQLSFFQGGIVVDAENIKTTAADKAGEQVGGYEGVTYGENGIPSDFMSFWSDALTELDEDRSTPRLIELSEISTSVLNSWYRSSHDIYSFKISCPGDETDMADGATYVTGTIQIPKNVDAASAPIEVWYCGYGIAKPGAQGSADNAGKIVITVAAHSIDYDFQTTAQPTSAVFNLPEEYNKDVHGSNYYGFYFSENKNREDIYFKYMLLRDIQAIRFLTQTFKADGELVFDENADETTRTLAETVLTPSIGIWDGEHIKTNGASQGGFQAVAVAALYNEMIGEREQRITELYASIPWMCDVQGNTDTKKVQSTYRQTYLQDGEEAVGLNYYDTANFGYFVQCDTAISAGMGDPLCPASGVTALYNSICANDSDINVTLGFTQGRTHEKNDNSAQHAEEKLYTYSSDAGIDSILTYEDPNGNFKAGIKDNVLYISSLGDDKILESTEGDAFVTYVEGHKTTLKTVKIIGKFAEIGDTFYIFRNLDSVNTIQIDYRTDTVGVCSTSDGHGNFYSMNGLKTVGHVEFDPNGNIVDGSRNNLYEANVVDLRGFKTIVNHTGNANYNTLPHDMLRGVGATKVIMPESIMCDGVDVAGVLPVKFLANVYTNLEVIVPARVSLMGTYFIWNTNIKTLRFEGGVTSDFSIGGKQTSDNNSTIGSTNGASVYLPSQADVDAVNAALAASEITEDKLKAVLAEGSYTVSNGILTVPFNGDSGIAKCDADWLYAMNGVTEVKIESGYSYLGANIFDMSTVSAVHIPESVTEISADCFSGVTDFTIIGAPGSYAESFAEANGIDFEMVATRDNVISAEGILAKIAYNSSIKDSVAIRFIFKWNARATLNVDGAAPVKVGVVACSADYYDTVAGENEGERLEALLADTNTAKVKRNDVAVYENSKMTLRGKFLSEMTNAEKGIYGYSYTLYDIPAEHYDSEIYAATYIEWDDGTYTVKSNGYTDASDKEKNTISLYDVTLGLFKQGRINSERVEDRYLWDVITSKSVKHVSADTFNVENYCLPDNLAGGYVLAYRAIAKFDDDGVTLKGARIGDAYEATGVNVSTNEYRTSIHTVVVDHGVTLSNGHRLFGTGGGTNAVLKTIVYPSDFEFYSYKNSTAATHVFFALTALENVIWCHTDTNGNYIEHMSGITWPESVTDRSSLVDLRGYNGIPKNSNLFYQCNSVKNVILHKDNAAITVPSGAAVWNESAN